jgi:hypothetical protein
MMLQMQHFGTSCVFSYIFHIYLVFKLSLSPYLAERKKPRKTPKTHSPSTFSPFFDTPPNHNILWWKNSSDTIQNDKNPRPATNKATLFLKVALLFLIIFADSFTGENVFDFCTESLTELSLAPIVSAIGARDFFAEAFFEESRKNLQHLLLIYEERGLRSPWSYLRSRNSHRDIRRYGG